MYPKIYYYPHKIIYFLVLLFRDPNILLLTLFFVYIFYHAFTHVRFFRSEFEKCLNIFTKDYKISYDDTIYIMNHSIPKDVGISKCNLHFLWVTTIFGFVITSPNASNLGYWSSHYGYLIANGEVTCIKSNSRVLVVVKCTCIYFHLMYFNDIWNA